MGDLPELDLSKPCIDCADGKHSACTSALCGCIAAHADDDALMRGFKRLKRMRQPEREAWVRGGWTMP